jgi:hypothetical protein
VHPDEQFLLNSGWTHVMTAEDGCDTWTYPQDRRKDWPDWAKKQHGTQHYWDRDKAVALQREIDKPPSPHLLRAYKQAARDIGHLFCWCLEHLPKFPPMHGEWLDVVKERLLSTIVTGEQAAVGQGKDQLTTDNKPGWYQCESKEQPPVTAVLWWDGQFLRSAEETVTGRGLMAMEWCTNFRGPLIVQAEAQAPLADGSQLSAVVCAGCGLPEVHKMCPAHGTPVYMDLDHPAWGNKLAIEYLQEIERLKAELAMWKPMTPEEAEAALAAVEAEPLDEEEINAIVEKVTDPAYRPSEPEHVLMAAEIRRLRSQLDKAQRSSHAS